MPGQNSPELEEPLVFYVNGSKVVESKPDPEMTLLTYLRTKYLTGAKLGCGEGGCGACTVMVSRYDAVADVIRHYNINACLAPLCSLHGLAVTTVEGIGSMKNIHPVQERIAKFHGSQCGFCTPGIVMSMYTLLRNNYAPTEREMEDNFDGNLCRCTGYRPILDGFRTFTKEFKCALGDQCCQNNAVKNGHQSQEDVNCSTNISNSSADTSEKVTNLEVLGPKVGNLKPYDSSQEPIFPPDLKVNHHKYHGMSHKFTGPNVTWLQPSTLTELIEFKTKYPAAKLVVGNTEIGVETKFKNMNYPVLISTTNVPELQTVSVTDHGVLVGAAVTLSQLNEELKKVVSTLPEHKTRVISSVVEMLQWFAGHQIRNVASLSGNIMTASPISDLNPLLVAAEATVCVQSQERGQRSLKIDKQFFSGYRKTAVACDEVLLSVTIPFTQENEYFAGYKQANRKDDDISLVNAGMMVTLSEVNTINKITLAFGGMGLTVVLANSTMESILGDEWNDSLIPKVSDTLASDLPLEPGAPGGFVEFRQALALSFFFKFFIAVRQQVFKNEMIRDLSAIQPMDKPPHRTMQVVGGVDSRLKTHDVVGKPLVHTSALQQSTGEAVYVDDMLPLAGELHLALVTSTRPHAKILSIDPSLALSSSGVVDFVSAADVPGVTSHGQVIGAVLAETQVQARNAARLVDIKYQDKQPVIITIADAIKHESYYKPETKIQIGDLEAGFGSSENILEGEVHIGGQYHFYMEPMSTRVLPGENGEMEVFSCTQHPSELQVTIAQVLNIPSNKIVVRVKRLGGGFGGKDSQIILSAVPAAVAARKTGRPVRCVLDRDVDMVSTGNRHPFLGKYKVGFTKEGKINALDLELYSNAGNSMDLSIAIMIKALLLIDSAIYIPNMRIVGQACRTNMISNTAFRGFGGPQGQYIMESILDDVANFLDLTSKQVQEINFFPPGALTHYDMPADGESVRRCWDMCLERSQYFTRKEQINQYNRENRWKKKGIALSPVNFGISILVEYMNQMIVMLSRALKKETTSHGDVVCGALVHIYRDGYVLVAHSGTEMGQGLHIKVAQIASEVLEISLSYIHISETSTNTIPNTMQTAASISTDLNGMAVKNACETLKERLKPYAEKMPKATWKELITAAYLDRVSLSSTGFYATPDIGYDLTTRKGKPYTYSTYGAACTEVQIDCLTGDHQLLRTDIVMDVGNSINPAIDIGQIEGAFAQGYGLYLLEDLKVTPDGSYLTRGPGNYKIPAFGNIPAEFNVYLVPDSPNPKAVFASRAVGEPPLLLASSAFFAVKDAIRAARKDVGASMKFQLNSPALPADIRMACQDFIAKKFPKINPETYQPWSVTL